MIYTRCCKNRNNLKWKMKKIESLTVLNGIEIELGVTRICLTSHHKDYYDIPVFITPSGFSAIDKNGWMYTYTLSDDWQLWEDPNKYWVPKDGEYYWHVNKRSRCQTLSFDTHCLSDGHNIKSGNFYKTQKEAVFARDKAYFVRRLWVWFHEKGDYAGSLDTLFYDFINTYLDHKESRWLEVGMYRDCHIEFKDELDKYFK